MSKPAPRSNFMQTFLLVTVIFLGYQLFFGTKPQDNRTADDVLKVIRDQNAKVLDVSITGSVNAYQGKLQSLLDAKKITQQEFDAKLLEAKILGADASYKAGMWRADFNRFNTAYLALHDIYKKQGKSPEWKTLKYDLPASNAMPARQWSADELYQKIITDLKERSKKDLVWGFFPGYAVIDGLVGLTGHNPGISYTLAALLLAFIVRALVWPLTQKQYKWGKQMAQLQPLMKELKEQYTDKKTGQISDIAEFNQKSMGMYREYGINPMAGCLPMLIQMPFFLIIFSSMSHYRFEFQNGTFLWVNPTTSASNPFFAPNLGETDYLLIVIYAISMIITTLLTPVSDPNNMKQQRLMGLFIAVFFSISMFFYPLPSAFVLYWVFTNIFATLQMLWVYRQPVPPLVKVNAPGGGVFPTTESPAGNAYNKAYTDKTGAPVKHKPKKKK